MTESTYIHHRPTLRRLLGTAVVFPDLEHHQRWSSTPLLGLAAGRHLHCCQWHLRDADRRHSRLLGDWASHTAGRHFRRHQWHLRYTDRRYPCLLGRVDSIAIPTGFGNQPIRGMRNHSQGGLSGANCCAMRNTGTSWPASQPGIPNARPHAPAPVNPAG